MSNGMTIALTGATGFIGRYLVQDLMRQGYRVRVLLRRPADSALMADSAVIGDLTRPLNLAEALTNVDAVIHSAGLAHTMTGLPEADYRAVNTEATAALAAAAARAGVKRFVFLSSIRAQTGPSAEGVIDENMPAAPTEAYGRSKLAAEQALAESGIDWVALRPVLTFGPGIKGNMARLVALARSPWPLPLGSLKARRSLLSIENLAEAVGVVLRHPAPLKRPLIVADDSPLTIGEMFGTLRRGLDRNPGIVPMPETLLRLGCALLGKTGEFERIAGPLVVNTDALKELGWRPPKATGPALVALLQQTYGA